MYTYVSIFPRILVNWYFYWRSRRWAVYGLCIIVFFFASILNYGLNLRVNPTNSEAIIKNMVSEDILKNIWCKPGTNITFEKVRIDGRYAAVNGGLIFENVRYGEYHYELSRFFGDWQITGQGMTNSC